MSEAKKVTYLVIDNDEETIRYKTDNLDRAIGFADCYEAECGSKCKISKVIME